MRVPCWQDLGAYGLLDWRADPLAVLAATDSQGREALARELRVLADMALARPAEFLELLESEDVLSSLAADRSGSKPTGPRISISTSTEPRTCPLRRAKASTPSTSTGPASVSGAPRTCTSRGRHYRRRTGGPAGG